MSSKNFAKKIIATTVVVGTAMHLANKYIINKATSDHLLKENDGNIFHFKYGDVFYRVYGEGKPVLLIHDINECSSGVEFSRIEKELSENYKVYTIDLLGCGRSDKPKLNYNNFLYIQLITDLIKEVIKEPINVIATGRSAVTVVMASKLAEEWIEKIMLISPTDLDELNEIPTKISKMKNYFILSPIVGTFAYHMAHTKEKISELFMTDYFSNPAADFENLVDQYYESAHLEESGSKYLYASLQGNYLNMNISHALKVLDKDILVVSGEDYYESDYVPEDYALLNENIEAITIMDTSYLPHLEAPEKVIQLIQQYWS